MMYAEDFRRIARQALTNRWGVAVGTGLVASILGGASSSFNVPNFQSSSEYNGNGFGLLNSQIGRAMLLIILGIAGISIVFAIVLFFISGAVTLGYVRFNKNLIDGNNPQFSDLFSRFNLLWRGFLMQLLVSIYTFLWTLLFIIPGFIAAFSYAMTPYILEENPYMPINDAIRQSKEMMRGNKWRLFCLEISFIGWAILCLLTCGIGFLWLTPYYNAAICAFYYDISGRFSALNENQGYQTPPSFQ